MKLSACRRLSLRPIHSTWFRAIATKHWRTALKTDHTPEVTTRFSPGKAAGTPIEILYLAESPLVALYEVGAIFGPPGRPVANPHQSKIVTIDVDVRLHSVADLSDPAQQELLDVSVQELTGNWDTYPPGLAPTQRLGEALYRTRGVEGFVAISARMPPNRTLIVFPQKLRKGSELVFQEDITGQTHRIGPR